LQLVTAPDQVWDSFLKVCVLLFIVRSLLTSNTCQSHPASSPFKKKGFPLFDELAYLCDDVLATGVEAFRGTGMGSGDLDGEGTVEEEDEEQEEGEDDPGLSQVSCVSLSAIHMTADIASI